MALKYVKEVIGINNDVGYVFKQQQTTEDAVYANKQRPIYITIWESKFPSKKEFNNFCKMLENSNEFYLDDVEEVEFENEKGEIISILVAKSIKRKNHSLREQKQEKELPRLPW